MRKLPIILGGTVALAILAAISKTKQTAAAATIKPATGTSPPTSPSTVTPAAASVGTPPASSTPAATHPASSTPVAAHPTSSSVGIPGSGPIISVGPATFEVASTIVDQVLAAADHDAAFAQSVWLNDNGYPKTAAALRKWANGQVSANELRQIAATEVMTPVVVVGPATIDVPSTIVEQLLASGDLQMAANQEAWLYDNGYPETAAALRDYFQGNISEARLRQIAETEFANVNKPNA